MAYSLLVRHPGVKFVALGWTGFIAENLVLSHHREELTTFFGAEESYLALYASCSTACMGTIAWGYLRHGRQGPRLAWSLVTAAASGPARARLAASFAIQATGLIGLSQMLPKFQVPVALEQSSSSPLPSSDVQPASASASASSGSGFKMRCPIDFKAAPGEGVHGMARVTRHVGLWGLAFATLGPAVATPFASTAVLLGMPTLVAIVGGAHKDYRYRRGIGGVLEPEVDEQTSNLPFAAILSGAQSFGDVVDELKPVNAAAATLVAMLLAVRRGRMLKNVLPSIRY